MTTPLNGLSRPTLSELRQGLPVALSFSIEKALKLIAEGRIEKARLELEDALRYADVVSPSVALHIGLDAVRPGKGL